MTNDNSKFLLYVKFNCFDDMTASHDVNCLRLSYTSTRFNNFDYMTANRHGNCLRLNHTTVDQSGLKCRPTDVNAVSFAEPL